MYKYYLQIRRWYKDKQWEIYILISIVLIVCIWSYKKIRGIEGTWSKTCKLPPIIDTQDILPENKESIGEAVCRDYLNKLFKKRFIKVRNIYNPVTHQYLELDCYNDELKLAIEYNGQQHYKYVPYFHKNPQDFRNQQYRDELKRIYCQQLGITLIEVPHTVKKDYICSYLYQKLYEYGYV